MLLRTAALALLLANAAYYAWSQGLLAPLGLQPAAVSEPERMGQQIRPEAVRIVPPASAAPAPSAPEAPASAAPDQTSRAGPAADLRARLQNVEPASGGLPPTFC